MRKSLVWKAVPDWSNQEMTLLHCGRCNGKKEVNW